MCGFFFSTRKNDIEDNKLVEKIKELLYKRGPDDQIVIKEDIGLFIFSRLSIIDVNQRSRQPMSTTDKNLTIMNNGEIYNYIELRDKYLENKLLRSEGDTEVFLEMWKRYGIKALKKLRGMYAFLVFDKKLNKIFFGRDPLGIKPLFYSFSDNDILISSETKVLRETGFRGLNLQDLPEMLIFGSTGDDRTGIKNIKRCIPGVTYIFDLNTRKLSISKTEKNFKNPKLRLPKRINLDKTCEYIENELKKSLEVHLRSDVGYSIQLSGGVDSSLLTALATLNSNQKQRTFGLEIKGSHQDEKWARELVIKKYQCEHTEVEIDSKIYGEYFDKTIKALDSPLIHSGSPALLRLYETMKDYSSVAITGEGADEAFMGYSRYRDANRDFKVGLLAKILPEFLIKKTKYKEALNYTRSRDPAYFSSVYSNTSSIIDIFPSLFKRGKFANPRSIEESISAHKRINSYDKKYYLQTLLHRQDAISMASSVECRTPFTDIRIFEITKQLPVNAKVSKIQTKKLLKKIAEKYLDHKIIYRKKIGLNIPLENWLRNEEIFVNKLEFLKSRNSFLAEFACPKKLTHYVDGFLNKNYSIKDIDMFRLLSIEEWLHLLNQK